MGLRIVLTSGPGHPGVARSLSLAGRVRVIFGRDASATWRLADTTRLISAKHCEIEREGADFWLHDHSTNGTFVNGAGGRIEDKHRLAAGDVIRIANYLFTVEEEVEEEDATAIIPPPPAAAAPAAVVQRGMDPAALPAAPAAAGAGVEEMTLIMPAPKKAPAAPAPVQELPPLLAPLAPAAIEAALTVAVHGTARKAALWDAYVAVWQTHLAGLDA